MYLAHFGLQKNPFGMTPDPSFLFMTAQHRESLAGLAYALLNRKGFAMLTGEAGTGKTTLLTKTLQSLAPSKVASSVVFNPILTPSEFMEFMMLDFGIREVPAAKSQRLMRFEGFLLEAHKCGRVAALVVDEAHKLSPAVLEEIRLLSNFEFSAEKLLQIVLIGQPELADLLNRDDLRQLKQRISVRLTIAPLNSAEVNHYLQFRWWKAGANAPLPFSPEAVHGITQRSHGIPRLINSICENALMLAFADAASRVEFSHVEHACRDLDLMREPLAPPNGSHAAVLLRADAAKAATGHPVNGTRAFEPAANGSTASGVPAGNTAAAAPVRPAVPAAEPVAASTVITPRPPLRVLEGYMPARKSLWPWARRARSGS